MATRTPESGVLTDDLLGRPARQLRVGVIDGHDVGRGIGDDQWLIHALEHGVGQPGASLVFVLFAAIDEREQGLAGRALEAQRIGPVTDRQHHAIGAPTIGLALTFAPGDDRAVRVRQRRPIGTAVMDECVDVLPDDGLGPFVAQEIQRAAVDVGAAPVGIPHQHRHRRGIQEAPQHPSLLLDIEQIVDAQQHLIGIIGFDQIIARPGFERAQARGTVVGGGHDQRDRSFSRQIVAADVVEDVESIHAGHVQIEHQQIGAMALDQVERALGARTADEIGIAVAAQDAAQGVDGGRVVVDDQNRCILTGRAVVQACHSDSPRRSGGDGWCHA